MRLPLDQNFPEPILEGLEPWMGDVQLVPLRTIDHRLTTLGDRELLSSREPRSSSPSSNSHPARGITATTSSMPD